MSEFFKYIKMFLLFIFQLDSSSVPLFEHLHMWKYICDPHI